ncbi:hypothetical protein [Acinetobacter radioresistens]|uniref:hypothetical protein n=1 Tax=Acinetobacter radioresistens TaxID=40216 RepID=UPI00028C77A0|nr:hypothetical protein [Acinetobacter radioresistens]BBL22192.1 hypothetical protein ACRAD_28630 [Acinetobacter radioresistens DSM 6976 = NBRC 102413 = CIP 103788]
MFKYCLIAASSLFSCAVYSSPYETRTYNQPPVITGEFEVEQPDQIHLANLTKDTETIEVESDFLGLKKFKRDTFDKSKIKERFDNGFTKLRDDEKTVKTNNHRN